MKKISLIATTVLTGLLLFPSVNDTTTHAAEVTSQDAQAVAIQAMKNSGGNPDLQNFKKVKDKGDYFTIDINNKSGAGVGTYKYTKMVWCYIKVEIMENIVNSIHHNAMLHKILLQHLHK